MEDCDSVYRYPTTVCNNDCKLIVYPPKSELKQGHWTPEVNMTCSILWSPIQYINDFVLFILLSLHS